MTMDINQVKFGNYSIGTKGSRTKKNEEQVVDNTAKSAQAQQSAKNYDIDAMFNAMNIAGMQNFAYISKAGAKEVNPSDYLSEERVSDIEAMMAEFESGVDNIANVLEAEFPGAFSQEQKNALAASIYAAE